MPLVGECFYCNEIETLCDAHIVPKSFFGDFNEKNYLEISTQSERTKRSRIGPYDQGILCKKCDQIIGIYDGYAKTLLVDKIDAYKQAFLPCYLIPKAEFDFIKLKKFFISLIWRACISSNPVFCRVSLGKYREIARQILKGEWPIEEHLFAVLIFKDAPTIGYADVLSCVRTKLAATHAYKFHFSGYQVTIVPNSRDMDWQGMDKSKQPSHFFLKNDNDLVILEVDRDLSGKEALLSEVRLARTLKRS